VQRFASHPVAARHARHVNPAFIELLDVLGYGRVFVRAKDVWVWDDEERRYLDLLAGFGAMNLGHNHPRLAARLREFLAADEPNLHHTSASPHAAALAEALAARTRGLDVCLFSNGGAEAVEAAIKVARAATGRAKIVSCEGGYHGTSVGALSVMDERRLRDPFEPLMPQCMTIPFGDVDALRAALADGKAAAFLVEPIQAEAGVRIASADYWQRARELCDRHGALLAVDEVQTGLGRTGTWLAMDAYGVRPDIVALAKSLGGGVAAIGATLTRPEINARAYGARDRFDLHGSTFGGNAFACVAALETLAILDDDHLIANAAERGAQLVDGLRARLAGHPLVVEVRGRGLLVAIELGPTAQGWLNRAAPGFVALAAEKVAGQWMALRLLEAGIICQPAAHAWNVLKIEPPLTIDAAQVTHAIETIGALFDEYRGVGKLAADVAARITTRSLARA
jgi:putrescine aminotransferase